MKSSIVLAFMAAIVVVALSLPTTDDIFNAPTDGQCAPQYCAGEQNDHCCCVRPDRPGITKCYTIDYCTKDKAGTCLPMCDADQCAKSNPGVETCCCQRPDKNGPRCYDKEYCAIHNGTCVN
eukprot:Colp12_sorted_trinity150504_noHs@35238